MDEKNCRLCGCWNNFFNTCEHAGTKQYADEDGNCDFGPPKTPCVDGSLFTAAKPIHLWKLMEKQ